MIRGEQPHWKTKLLLISIPNSGLWYLMERTITIPFYLNPEAADEDRAELLNNW